MVYTYRKSVGTETSQINNSQELNYKTLINETKNIWSKRIWVVDNSEGLSTFTRKQY